MIEKLTGMRFEDYVKQTFFDRIGMPTADYFHSARTRALLTNLYHRDGRTPYPYTTARSVRSARSTLRRERWAPTCSSF